MSLASVIETTQIDHGDGCRCTLCSYLKVVIIDPETCEPAPPGGGSGVDLTVLIEAINNLNANIEILNENINELGECLCDPCPEEVP